MRNEFTAVFERDNEWVIAYCPEIPGANGQGRSKDDARESLRQAIALILLDRREEGLRAVPRHTEISNNLARKICRGLGIPEIGE